MLLYKTLVWKQSIANTVKYPHNFGRKLYYKNMFNTQCTCNHWHKEFYKWIDSVQQQDLTSLISNKLARNHLASQNANAYMSTLRHSYGDSVILASLKTSVPETKISVIWRSPHIFGNQERKLMVIFAPFRHFLSPLMHSGLWLARYVVSQNVWL